jgi:hypothetical protein
MLCVAGILSIKLESRSSISLKGGRRLDNMYVRQPSVAQQNASSFCVSSSHLPKLMNLLEHVLLNQDSRVSMKRMLEHQFP